MSKFSLFLILIIFISAPAFLHAQTAADLETVLETHVVTCRQAAWFVLSAGNVHITNRTSAEDTTLAAQIAFQHAVARGWLKNSQPNDPITLGKLSFLIMRAFYLNGGVMYLLFPGPRYAYRSMVSHSYIQGIADPSMTVSGERFMDILGKVLSAQGYDL